MLQSAGDKPSPFGKNGPEPPSNKADRLLDPSLDQSALHPGGCGRFPSDDRVQIPQADQLHAGDFDWPYDYLIWQSRPDMDLTLVYIDTLSYERDRINV
ncbi:hypothetical protein D3C76_1301340 [compost metagenome]